VQQETDYGRADAVKAEVGNFSSKKQVIHMNK
jgi:hypothetical protein